MRQILLVIFSIISILANAQEAEINEDSVTKRPVSDFFQPAVYVDYGKAITYFSNFETKYAVGAQIRLFSLLLLTGEYGNAIIEPNQRFENIDYKSEGSFYKVGGGLYTDFLVVNKIGIGGRYASSSFQDSALGTIEDNFDLVGDYTTFYSRSNLSARWFEIFIESERKVNLNRKEPKSKLNNLLGLGFNFQWRRMLEYDEQPTLDINNIPGFGKPVNRSVIAVNFLLKVYLLP